jgi:hypothetical protein
VRIQPSAAHRDSQPEPTGRLERALRTSARLGEERSLVDLVLLACEFGDDPLEIEGLVDGLVTEASSRLLRASEDPMLRGRPAAQRS